MYICDVKHWSNQDKEADILVTDGDYQLLCYAQPFSGKECQTEVAALYAIGCGNIVKSENCAVKIAKQTDYYAYELSAEVLSKVERTVKLGQLVLHLDEALPGDIQNGDYVTFRLQRIDAINENGGQ